MLYKPSFMMAIVVEVPNIGTCIVVAVYIPPVWQGYMAYKYADIWDGLMESVQNLQLAQKVLKDNVLIIGDFNAHVGAYRGGYIVRTSCHWGGDAAIISGFWLTVS